MATFAGGETLGRVLNFHFISLSTGQGTVRQNVGGFLNNSAFYEVPAGKYAELYIQNTSIQTLNISDSSGNVNNSTPWYGSFFVVPDPTGIEFELNPITLIAGQKVYRASESAVTASTDKLYQFMIKEFNIPA